MFRYHCCRENETGNTQPVARVRSYSRDSGSLSPRAERRAILRTLQIIILLSEAREKLDLNVGRASAASLSLPLSVSQSSSSSVFIFGHASITPRWKFTSCTLLRERVQERRIEAKRRAISRLPGVAATTRSPSLLNTRQTPLDVPTDR